MIIKAELIKPYTEIEKLNFIVAQNHKNGYKIEAREDRLVALGFTQEELDAQRRERIDNLKLTAADVERAIYEARGIDFEDIVKNVQIYKPEMDVKRLKIELKANDFFRGHPYINEIGALLGYTTEDMDYLFMNKTLPKVVETEEK